MVITENFVVFAERYSQPESVVKKSSWSRNNLVETENWIISKDTLNMLESEAKKEDNPHKYFTKSLYALPEYISHFKKVKRGNNAKNWKKDNKYICDSLHYAVNIYQSLGKLESLKKESKREYSSKLEDVNRCVVITKKGTQCKRNKKNGCDMCTQHFNLIK